MAKSFGNDNTPRHVRKRELDRFGVPLKFSTWFEQANWSDYADNVFRDAHALCVRTKGGAETSALSHDLNKGGEGGRPKGKARLSGSALELLAMYDVLSVGLTLRELRALPRSIAEEEVHGWEAHAGDSHNAVNSRRAKAIETRLRRLLNRRRDDQARHEAEKAAWAASSYLATGSYWGPPGSTALSTARDDD